MTLKLIGIIDEPKEDPVSTIKESITPASEPDKKATSEVESTGYLTPEEVIAVSADKVE